MEVLEVILLLVGFILGYFSKGITIVKKEPEIPEGQGYNPSYLPQEIKDYYDSLDQQGKAGL